jgi:hypothetical protein
MRVNISILDLTLDEALSTQTEWRLYQYLQLNRHKPQAGEGVSARASGCMKRDKRWRP